MKPGPKRQYIVDPDTGCHISIQYTNHGGYAHYKRNGVRHPAARVVWMETHGREIPDGMQIDHLCGARNCVNPDHLEAVTPAENIRRSRVAKLDWDQVRAIRSQPDRTGAALAREYEVSQALISMIRSGKVWREDELLKASTREAPQSGPAPQWSQHARNRVVA